MRYVPIVLLLLACGAPPQRGRLYAPCTSDATCDVSLLCVAGTCTIECTGSTTGGALGACVSAGECLDRVHGCCRITDTGNPYGYGICVVDP